MKKILVPIDFSENAYNALKYGVKLFEDEECVFHLMHTYTPSLYNSEYMIYSTVSIDEIYRLNGLKSLTNIVKRLKKDIPNEKHSFKKIASFNLLQDEIKNQVKGKGIDLIIMGTQGATDAAQILFGTHTVHAIRGAICPLLAIPANYEFKKPEHILFPSDYELDLKEEKLEIIKKIAEKFSSIIHVLHIMKEVQNLPKDKELNKKALTEFLRNVSHKFHSIKYQTVPQGVFYFQEKTPIDLLVMIRHKHSFFQNLFFRPVVNQIGFRLTSPFLVIPVLNKEINKTSHEKNSFTN